MPDPKVKIRVYSDASDVTRFLREIRTIENRNISLSVARTKKIVIEQDEILVFRITAMDSRLLDQIIAQRNELDEEIIFVIESQDPMLVSTIAKFGYTYLYLLPQELYRFKNDLNEFVNNVFARLEGSFILFDPSGNLGFSSIIGSSEDSLKVIEVAKKIAENRAVNVLILGETGTGKGMLARAIHHHTYKDYAPFVDVLCTAIPEQLLESELFGHERGAFTNALSRKLGLFELAEKGTIFLDEIGDLGVSLQVKLLRVIEKKVIRRIGGLRDLPVDVRIISATNQNLAEMVEVGKFRNDLYHRLDVVSIELKPLRERGEDIMMLTEHFIDQFSRQFKKPIKKIERELVDFINNYHWPGNIRELRNAVERGVLLSDGDTMKMKSFENLLRKPVVGKKVATVTNSSPNSVKLDLDFKDVDITKLNQLYAKAVFEKMNKNKTLTAQYLGVSRPTLDRLLE